MKNLPDKIYLSFGEMSEDKFEKEDYKEFCEYHNNLVGFHEQKFWETDVEYIRKDAFIEKELDYDNYMNFFKEHPEYSNIDWGFDECWVFAKYFYKLGLKADEGEKDAQSKGMIEALRTEYEKGRADVIADTLSWLENCWPKYCSNQTIIEGFKEAMKE